MIWQVRPSWLQFGSGSASWASASWASTLLFDPFFNATFFKHMTARQYTSFAYI
jgi:hypothetical protein